MAAPCRHELNAVGDHPTRDALERLLARAQELHLQLPEHDISDELSRIRASLTALALHAELERGEIPVVPSLHPLAPGDQCHFAAPVRFGRRRSDQLGHLALTSGWLRFHGAIDISVAWSEVSRVSRVGCDIEIALRDSRRLLRFCCQMLDEAARGAVIANHLAVLAHGDGALAPSTSTTPRYRRADRIDAVCHILHQ